MRDSILDSIFEKHIRRQRPYYLLQGKPIAGVNRQHWLVFQHRDYKKQGNWLQGLVSLFSFKGQEKPVSHRILRIDPTSATVFTYHPRQDGDIPTTTLLRVGTAETVGRFLHLHSQQQETDLLPRSKPPIAPHLPLEHHHDPLPHPHYHRRSGGLYFGPPIVADSGIFHADDCSMAIGSRIWEKLREG